jgi:protein phosphatase
LQEQLDAGWITPAQAAHSSIRNLVTRALGVEGDVQLEIHVHPVAAGDVYLLCSDGLTDMVTDAGMARIFSTAPSLEAIAAGLVDAANENGGRDNISVLITQVGGSDEKRGLIARLLGK